MKSKSSNTKREILHLYITLVLPSAEKKEKMITDYLYEREEYHLF